MKTKLILISLLTAVLVSCDSGRALNAVRKHFPDSDVSTVPGKTRVFVIRTQENEVWIAESSGMGGHDNSVVYKSLIIPAQKSDVRSNLPSEVSGK